MRAWCLIASWIVLVAGVCPAQELAFRRDGRPLATLSLQQLTARFPPQKVTLEDRLDNSLQTYLALSVPALLESVYGAAALQGDADLIFMCSDGYDANVPADELSRYEGYLAYGFANGSPFRLKEELGPFYLIWDTRKFPDRKLLGSWPYQVTAIDLVRFEERFPRVLPPSGSAPEVMRGFQAFRHFCLSCHKLNEQGGDRAPDLNFPVSVTEYIRDPYLKEIIDNPARVRGSGIMPGLKPDLPDRAKVIEDLVAYLKAMAKKRR